MSGGDLQTCAVIRFCKLVSTRFWRAARNAPHILLILLSFLPFLGTEGTAGPSGWATAADTFLDIFSVSLYSVCETSSSLCER